MPWELYGQDPGEIQAQLDNNRRLEGTFEDRAALRAHIVEFTEKVLAGVGVTFIKTPENNN